MGTVTEIYDYLRLLYARIGIPHCPECGRPVTQQSAQEIVDAILEMPPRTRLQVLAPLVRGRKGHHRPTFDEVAQAGFRARARRWRTVYELEDVPELDRYKIHDIEAVVDRLVVPESDESSRRNSIAISSAASPIRWRRRCGWGTVFSLWMLCAHDPGHAAGTAMSSSRKGCVRRLRAQSAGDRTANLLVQQPARRVSDVPGSGLQAGTRPRSDRAESESDPSTKVRL